MKKRIHIPNQRRFQKPRKQSPKPVKDEAVELKDLQGYDRKKVARLVNLCFILSDIQEGIIIDVETEIRKADPTLTLPMRHPIERIKAHTRAMVQFVDKKTTGEYSEGFGTLSDKIKEELFRAFHINEETE